MVRCLDSPLGAWIRIRMRVYAYAEKPCIWYTGVRVDGCIRFIRFHLYTKSVVPSVYDGTVRIHAPPGIALPQFACKLGKSG